VISLRYRDSLPGESNVLFEFESLVAQLKGFLSVSHNDDGSLKGLSFQSANIVPVGTGPIPFSGVVAPTGWVFCQGQQLSRITYKALYEVIGTTYGAGDGSTTFHLPDARGRYILGKAASGTGSTLGGTFGSLDHTHSEGSHSHTFSGTTSANGGFSSSTGSGGGQTTSSGGSHSHSVSGSTSNETGGFFSTSSGSGQDVAPFPHGHDISGSTDSAGSHTHTVSDHSHSISQGDHQHTYSGTTSGAGSGTTGSGNVATLVTNMIIFAGV
jgi:microcystin-dependent protein